MATERIIHIPNALPKAFSSHPGHGNAGETVAQFQKVLANSAKFVYPAEAAMERQDHSAKARRTFP